MKKFKILVIQIVISIIYFVLAYFLGDLYFRLKWKEGVLTYFEKGFKVSLTLSFLFLIIHLIYVIKNSSYAAKQEDGERKIGFRYSTYYLSLVFVFLIFLFFSVVVK